MRQHRVTGGHQVGGKGRTRTIALVSAVTLAAAGFATVTASTSQAATSITVKVDPSVAKGAIPAIGQGVNEAVWDAHMNDADQPALLRAAGVTALRYPGGSYGDNFHWKDNTAEGGYVAPNTSFDQFMTTAKGAGAQPILIANYGSGTPQEAADWVSYANKTKGYGVKYWEIGNEIPGNGHYGARWETDNHADKSPKAYATNALQYISAMKAVDPSIKIGIVLCTPGSWPDGQVAAGDTADWNNTVLSIVGAKADFGIVHWYPTSTSPTDNLAKPPTEIPAIMSALRGLYAKYNAPNLGTAITELDAAYQNDSATAGLFAADSYLTWWENGVFTTDWWTLRNGSDGKTSTNGDGTIDYGEGGIVSPGGNGTPALNTPYPTYFGLSMAARAGSPGDTLVFATASDATLKVHAVRTASGAVNVLLINESLNDSATVALSYTGYTPAAGSTVQQWAKGATAITTASASSTGSLTLPPYSITLLQTTADSRPAPAPSTPSATTPATPTPTTPATPTPTSQPCDIYASGGTPCVAAHSTTRALFASYSGPLYQVRRSSDNTTLNITPLSAGGVANAAAQDSFCANTTCLITVIYDQTSRHNNLTQAPPGGFNGPAAGGYDNLANATAAPVTVGGQKAYGVYVAPGTGYRNNTTTGIATGDAAEGMYAIFDGTHYNGGCCFDYGNAERNSRDNGNGTMEAIYFGNIKVWGYGTGNGPWIMADLENGLYSGINAGYNANDPSISNRFTTAIIKGEPNHWSIRGGNAQSGGLSTFYNGARPNAAGYNPMKKEGAIILGIGGDNSVGAAGTFYEGVMTSGYPTDATENSVQANITAAGYATGGSTTGPTVGSTISLRATTACCTTRYISHSGATISTQVVSSSNSATAKANASWIVRAGLANGSCVSFESKNTAGSYLRHQNYHLYLHANDGSSLFANDATFCPQPGMNGQGTSFTSNNYSTRYIRHNSNNVYIASNGGSNTFDSPNLWSDDVSWVVTAPWTP